MTTPPPTAQVNPCLPSPCGPFATCQDRGGYPSCTCMPSYIGSPPYCRAECSINSDCISDKACIREKCRDPCPGSCGINALCTVINHTPACTCPDGYSGDPFSNCYLAPMPGKTFDRTVSDIICIYSLVELMRMIIVDLILASPMQRLLRYRQIHVTHHRVDPMPNAVMVSAVVYPNIEVILIGNVGRNACKIPTVHMTELARTTSAWIPASGSVVKTRNARLSITWPLVAAFRITKAIHSPSADECNVSPL